MIEEVATNIYRIGVPLPQNPLKETNSYFIRGHERDLLIDTGFRRDECRIPLLGCLGKLGAKQGRLDVLVTHVHSDHSGLAAELASTTGKIYLSQADTVYLEKIMCGRHGQAMHHRMVSEGFPEALLSAIEETMPSRIYSIEAMDHCITPLKDGDSISVGDYCLQMVFMPGHTPGNTMYWIEDQQIMFTGDHILFDITPNITAFADEDDSLGCYIDSLRRATQYPVKLALPGHRKPGNYLGRIWELLQHHRDRIVETQTIINQNPGLTGYQIAARMSWNIRAKSWEDFPGSQKWYAVGECLSHLDYLCNLNFTERTKINGLWTYRVLRKPNISSKLRLDEHIAFGALPINRFHSKPVQG